MNGFQGKVINFRKRDWRLENIFPNPREKFYPFQHTAIQRTVI